MSAEIAELLPLSAYREQRAHIFPSPTSLDWFLRKHRAGLVRSGGLLMLGGRWLAMPSQFDSYVLALGEEEAIKQTE